MTQVLKNLSLRFKIPLRVSALILVVGVAVGLSLLLRTTEVFREDLKLSSENLSRVLARTLTPALLHDDIWKAYEIINTPFTVNREQGSLQAEVVFVLDPEKRIYVSTDPKRYRIQNDFGEDSAELAVVRRKIEQNSDYDQQFLDFGGLEHIYVITPIESDNVLLGTLVVGYSNALFERRFISFSERAAFTTLTIIAVLLPLGAYWGRQLAEPLVELARCMSEVGKAPPERLSCDIGLDDAGDELGQLNRQFQVMLGQLREKSSLEKQMVAAERLAAIGRFTAGIAHEINNPLGGMLNATNTLRRHGNPDPLTQRTLELIERGLVQIKDTVGALLVEARTELRPLSHQDVEDTRTLVSPEVSKKRANIDWHNGLDDELALPATLVRQILINLLLNAVQAVPEEGTVSCWVQKSKHRFSVRISNTGERLDEETIAHLFEPFTTGREAGRGLGLWVTYQIVTQLNGEIKVRSTDQGTEFTVNVPVALEVAA